MSSSWVRVLDAISVVTLVCVLCYQWLCRRSSRRRSAGGGGGDVGGTSGDGWSLGDWFNSSPVTDNPGGGGWDSGSGGDSGGGDGGGDGGGGDGGGGGGD